LRCGSLWLVLLKWVAMAVFLLCLIFVLCSLSLSLSSVLSVYYASNSSYMLDHAARYKFRVCMYVCKICLKFAPHHFLLYAIYICQKSLNFTYAFKCYQQNIVGLSWLHFNWATLYIHSICFADCRHVVCLYFLA